MIIMIKKKDFNHKTLKKQEKMGGINSQDGMEKMQKIYQKI